MEIFQVCSSGWARVCFFKDQTKIKPKRYRVEKSSCHVVMLCLRVEFWYLQFLKVVARQRLANRIVLLLSARFSFIWLHDMF